MRSLTAITIAILSLAAVSGLGLTPAVAAAASKKPFTAIAVQTAPNMAMQSGRIYVSFKGTRYEFSENGRDMVQIILSKQKLMRILFPKDKVYMEFQAPADTPDLTSDTDTPCPPVDAVTCNKLGVDKFGDMEVERWQQSFKGVQGQSTLWWEPQRKMIVRQEFPDGRIVQLQLSGSVDFNNRPTEKWDISYAQPGKAVTSGLRLVDTDLGIIVKEQSPSGLVRELRDLQVVEDNPDWFAVPDDFQRIEPPKAPAAPTQ